MVWSSQSKSYKADCETPLRMSGENFENFCKNLFSKKKKDFFLPEYAYVSFSHLAIAAILARFYKFDEQP
jgi:hypothetical protein